MSTQEIGEAMWRKGSGIRSGGERSRKNGMEMSMKAKCKEASVTGEACTDTRMKMNMTESGELVSVMDGGSYIAHKRSNCMMDSGWMDGSMERDDSA